MALDGSEPMAAQVSYTKSSACINCGASCQAVRPVVRCNWGRRESHNYGVISVEVSEFSPVVRIWDGASSSGNKGGGSGQYFISMCVHKYYYLDRTNLLCFNNCALEQNNLHDPTRLDFPPSHASRYWGRKPGDGGFVERNQHNIYNVTSDRQPENPSARMPGQPQSPPSKLPIQPMSRLGDNSFCERPVCDTVSGRANADTTSRGANPDTMNLNLCM